MNGRPAQITGLDQRSHAPRNVAELAVMTHGQLESFLVCQADKPLRALRVEGKGLLDIHMAIVFEAEAGDFEVAFRRGRNVDHVRPGLQHQLGQFGEAPFYPKPVGELPGHERLTVAYAHDLTSFHRQDLRRVSVGYLAASDNSDLKH